MLGVARQGDSGWHIVKGKGRDITTLCGFEFDNIKDLAFSTHPDISRNECPKCGTASTLPTLDELFAEIARSAHSGWIYTGPLLEVLNGLGELTGKRLLSPACPYCQGTLIEDEAGKITCLRNEGHGEFIKYCSKHEGIHLRRKNCSECEVDK